MEKIFSKASPDVLLAIINRLNTVTDQRKDLTPAEEFLQVSCFKMHEGKTFRAHKHLEQKKITTITQESFVVIKGKIKTIIYDLDDTIIAEPVINAGDCVVTLYGGHNYLGLEDETIIYEHKTGPYYGVEKDKKFIDYGVEKKNG